MECNKDEAIRAKELALRKMQDNDFAGARKIALKAQQLFPELENINHLLAVCNVHCSAQTKILGSEKDWYGILQVERLADDATIRKQYRKLALLLHPDKNNFAGAEAAFKLIGEANVVLSDRGKRSLYDSRFGVSIKSAQAKPPTQQVNKNQSGRKQQGLQNNTPNGFSPSSNFPNQTAEFDSSVSQDSFWTCCPFCSIKYQYYRNFVNRALRCQKCNKPFIAYDIAAQGVPPRTNQSQAASQDVPPRTNQSQAATQGVPPKSNWSQPATARQKEIPVQGSHRSVTKETAGFPAWGSGSQGSASTRKVESDSGTQVRGTYAVGSNVKTQKNTNPVGRRLEGVRTPKTDETKQGEESNLRDNKRKRGKLEAEPSEISDTLGSSDSKMIIDESVSDIAAEKKSRVNDFYGRRRSSRQKHEVSYIESEGEDDGLENAPKRPLEGKSTNGQGQQEGMVDQDPNRDTLFKQKETDPPSEANNQLGKNQVSGAAQVEVDDSESDPYSEDEQIVFDCTDPEFNDFDKGRAQSCFAVDQFWACYGNADGMPRYYAQIKKVYSTGFKLRIMWLESDPDDDEEIEWMNKGLPVGCGKYRRGNCQDTIDHLTFSHRIYCEKGSKRGSFCVYPRKGEIWALFKDWDIKWSTEAENHESYKFEIVEVLTDFEKGVGIKASLLDKVGGFISLFHRRSDMTAEFVIPPNELFRFSHKIPYFKMTGTEREGVPEGSFELDPASLPSNPNDVCYPSMFKMDYKDLGRQQNSVLQGSSPGKSRSKKSETLSTSKKSDLCNGKRVSDGGEDSVPRRTPRGLNTRDKENVPSQSVTSSNLNRKGRSCNAEVLSREDKELLPKSNSRSNSICSSISSSRNVVLDQFHDFNGERSPGKFEEGQVWALYGGKDKLPMVYGQIKKVGFVPHVMHVALLEACSVSKTDVKPVCGSFKVQNGRPKSFEYSYFSHLLDVNVMNKNKFEVYPKGGQVWALYKNWNSEFSSSDLVNCEYEIVEIIDNSNGIIKVISLVPLRGYKSVFRSPRKSRSSIGPMDIAANEYARFSHQIPAFLLTTEKGGSLAGCLELDPVAVPRNILPAK
ncbi:hypothetical protein M9H77_06896 [Catharanthus roseus]|uniref:Uncharacterized protein n=1 Tax=Catharanthus roseus TaxID=4058 RepID=A0ACC0BTE2_CATRO|nr:hypothetical protein M9H77_06896 [Catharanthus roseus]